MTCVYIKMKLKKKDTMPIDTAKNEACKGKLDENGYLMGKEWMTLLIVEDVKS